MLSISSWIERGKAHQRATHDSGGTQEHERQRDLGYDKAAQRPACTSGNATGARSEGLFDGTPVRSQCRYQSEDQGRQDRTRDCKEQHAPIDMHLVGARQLVRPEAQEATRAQDLQQEPERAATNAEHAALNQTLTE